MSWIWSIALGLTITLLSIWLNDAYQVPWWATMIVLWTFNLLGFTEGVIRQVLR